MRVAGAIGLAALAAAARAAIAAEIELDNGRVLEGDVASSDERTVTIEIPDVGTMTMNRSEIRSIDGHALPAAGPISPTRGAPSERAQGKPQADEPWATFHRRQAGLSQGLASRRDG
jgi:hypothetical protein